MKQQLIDNFQISYIYWKLGHLNYLS
jgi:hypothetical protein